PLAAPYETSPRRVRLRAVALRNAPAGQAAGSTRCKPMGETAIGVARGQTRTLHHRPASSWVAAQSAATSAKRLEVSMSAYQADLPPCVRALASRTAAQLRFHSSTSRLERMRVSTPSRDVRGSTAAPAVVSAGDIGMSGIVLLHISW